MERETRERQFGMSGHHALSRGEAAVAAVFLLSGILLAAQMKGVHAQTQAQSDNVQYVLDLEERCRQESARADKLQADLEAGQQQAAQGEVELQTLRDRVTLLEFTAGVTDISGPGVSVVMEDSTARNVTGNEADYLIHDSDLLRVINELRAAGAEALSLNGERILATSEVRCAGPVVTINGVQKSAPFTIFAIGDSDTLYDALTMRNGVVDILEAWKISVKVVRSDQLTIPGYGGRLEYRYAAASSEVPDEEEVG